MSESRCDKVKFLLVGPASDWKIGPDGQIIQKRKYGKFKRQMYKINDSRDN